MKNFYGVYRWWEWTTQATWNHGHPTYHSPIISVYPMLVLQRTTVVPRRPRLMYPERYIKLHRATGSTPQLQEATRPGGVIWCYNSSGCYRGMRITSPVSWCMHHNLMRPLPSGWTECIIPYPVKDIQISKLLSHPKATGPLLHYISVGHEQTETGQFRWGKPQRVAHPIVHLIVFALYTGSRAERPVHYQSTSWNVVPKLNP